MSKEPNERVETVDKWSSKLIGHFVVAASITLCAQSGIATRQANAQPATKVGRYTLQSNPWVNLHQRLLYEARFKAAPPSSLSGEDLQKWQKAVEAYRVFLGKRSPIFDDELVKLNATLSKTSTFKLPDSIPEAASTVLKVAMPLYRSVQWEQDDRANRFPRGGTDLLTPQSATRPQSRLPKRNQTVAILRTF